MKTKLIVLFAAGLMGFNTLLAQDDCNTNLSLFNDSAKAGIFEDALPRYKKLIKECPGINIALYQRADKMFEEMIEEAEKANDEAKVSELAQMEIENFKLRLENFPKESPKGKIYPDIGKVMYENKFGSVDEMFKYFDDAWNQDPDNFRDPKGLYIYFLLFDQLEDADKKTINELFVKYDEVINQIERMENDQAVVAKPLITKQENQEKLDSKEARKLRNSGIYLRNYALIKKGINNVLGQKADCDNLIPMYNKDFEEKKGDKEWLRVAASKMSGKDCTSDPLFFKLVEALHELEPSARTAFYLGRLAAGNNDMNKALEYYKNAAELEEDPLDKAKDYFTMAEVYKNRGALSSARKYYQLALDNKPSMGISYLRIAAMIAGSANDCGDTTFNKRAVYWKAANYARRAASVDASLKDNANETASSYEQRAPSKSDIFQEGMQGKTVTFSCWVGGSVKVPNLKD
jgi:tetratricopeptide (TPR) repeat protein